MEVRSIELTLRPVHVRAVIADAAGEREVALAGAGAERVVAAAAALIAAMSDGMPIDSLSIDLGAPTDLADAIRPVAQCLIAELKASRPARTAMTTELSPGFWTAMYDNADDGWEIARATPPLARWVESNPVRGARVLVVGAGRGHEARLLARAGADVVAVDFAPPAIEAARALAAAERVVVDFRLADLFDLPREPDRYDLVMEHCCFCALAIATRAAYVNAMADVLVSDGRLVGLFWAHTRPGGPPFAVAQPELLSLFGERFNLDHIEVPSDSIVQRAGEELLATFRRRS